MKEGGYSHRIVLTAPDLPRAGEAVGALGRTGVTGRQVRVFHQQLPGGVGADEAPRHFPALTSPWRWAGKWALYGVPLGLLLWLTGMHWLWLPGAIAIGAVWGWFARFYLDLFRGELTADLASHGVPREDTSYWQAHITDGETVLVVLLEAGQVPAAVDALEAAGFPDRRIYLP